MRVFACMLLLSAAGLFGAALSPETSKAFDRYVQLTEAEMAGRNKPGHYLWIDEHPRDKSRLWLNQNYVTPHKTTDGGKDVEVPDGVIQDWLGEAFLPGVTLERVRDTLLSFDSFKDWFKPDIAGSKLEKREGDIFDALLKVHRRQIQGVTLNIKVRAQYSALDDAHAMIAIRSTHIGEIRRGTEEAAPDDEHGFLWRMNMYWRLEAADNGVYAELETITLSRAQGRFASEKVLRGFVDTFPRSFTAMMSETARKILEPPKVGK